VAEVKGCISSEDKESVVLFTSIKGAIISSPWKNPKLTVEYEI